jgi:hypothetical protein
LVEIVSGLPRLQSAQGVLEFIALGDKLILVTVEPSNSFPDLLLRSLKKINRIDLQIEGGVGGKSPIPMFR